MRICCWAIEFKRGGAASLLTACLWEENGDTPVSSDVVQTTRRTSLLWGDMIEASNYHGVNLVGVRTDSDSVKGQDSSMCPLSYTPLIFSSFLR